MRSKNTQDAYICHLLNSIKNKRQFSIENAHKTDLYSAEELLEFMKWFDELCKLVEETPPSGYVRVMNVIENKEGRIISIQYNMFQNNESLGDTELNLIFDQYL